MAVDSILSQSYGYGFVVGLGAAFAVLMMFVSKLLAKYNNEVQNSESLTTASRSVKSGLIASAVVSSWCWPATMLLSSVWSFNYGIAGSFLYSLGGSNQIFMFIILAIELKRRAPGAHTLAETIKVRFGSVAHLMYISYVMSTNIIVSGCLLLGGAQNISTVTGMHVIAASFLLPLFIAIYTSFGGIKATFISDWIHTVIIFTIICVMTFVVFGSSSIIGSPSKLHDLLKVAEETTNVNYLSFKHKDIVLISWSVSIGGLSSVFCDPSYSQKSIASSPKSVLKGYVLGGFAWMSIPFALGTSAGLACRALLNTEHFISYPNTLSEHQISAGLPLIYGMASVLGKSGASAGILIIFMSVTSATSAELIAFSSVATYDVYRPYINPKASGADLVKATHFFIFGFSLFMACIAVVFNYIGVTVSWLLSFEGILLTPAVFPTVLTIFWSKMTRLSMIFSLPMGSITGIVCWIGATYHYADGVINKNTVMTTEATVIGNFVSLFSSLLYIVVISLLKPEAEPFDFKIFETSFSAGDDANEEELELMKLTEDEQAELKSSSLIASILALILLFGGYVIVPVSYYGSGYTFTKGYFYQWIVIMCIWLLISAVVIIILPLYQGRHAITKISKSLFTLSKFNKQEKSSQADGDNSDDVQTVKVEVVGKVLDNA